MLDAPYATPAAAPTMDRAGKPAIRLSGVRKEYRLYNNLREQVLDVLGLGGLRFWRPVQYKTFSALDGIDLEIGHGERVGIIGRNGAGKTTLLKLITGNFAPTAGEIEVDGEVQALMQTGLGFHGEFTGIENIKASLVYNGLAGADLEAAVEDIVDFCELGDFLYQPVKTYSLGMRARLQFAAATAIKPDIVIVDEVLGAGDAYFSAKSAFRIDRLAKSGCTLLLVSHSLPQVLQFCDRAIWLEEGRVRMEGAARSVVSAYEVRMEREISGKRVPANAKDKRTDAWLTELVACNDLSEGEEEGTASAHETEIDGRRVFRWPGKTGVKIQSISIQGRDGESAIFRTGGALEVEMELETETDVRLDITYYLSIFDLRGHRVAWITSPQDAFQGRKGERRRIRATLHPLLLGGGDYIISVSIFDTTPEHRVTAEKRHDLLARSFDLKVIEHDGRQSPMFHHPSDWEFHAKVSAS